jgi:hypothetical protein
MYTPVTKETAEYILQRPLAEDEVEGLQLLNEESQDNEFYLSKGRADLINQDFGPELNDLAKRLGIPYTGERY